MTVGAAKSADKQLQRIDTGKGHWYKIDGQKADGVTWVLQNSVPKQLTGWAAGTVAELAFDDPVTFEAMKKVGRDGFVEAMKKVPFNERDLAGNKGTAVHKLSESLAIGEEVEVPDYLAGHVDSYLQFRDLAKPVDEMVEISVFNLKYRYGGTLDSWQHLEVLKRIIDPRTGKPFCTCEDYCLSLVDLKTNRSGPYGETCLQLAAYDGAEVYIDAAGGIREMPVFSHHFVLWIRSDGFDLIPFYVTPKDFKTFLYCQQVAHFTDWKTGRVQHVKGEALTLPRS